HAILADYECHHAGRPVFRRIGHESEALCHVAIYDVILRAAWSILSLTRKDVEIVTAVRGRSAVSSLRIALSNGRCHKRSNGALRLALGSFPVKAIVLPFITEDFLGVLLVLRRVFLLRCHQFLANADG